MGTDESVKRYRTFGITTLEKKHVTIGARGNAVFEFVGKSQVKHRKLLTDPELAGLLQELKGLGRGRKIFSYLNADKKPVAVTPAQINAYIKAATAPHFSAKDFRTWGATLMAATELTDAGLSDDEAQIRQNIINAVKKVARELGNTPAVCRASYIHPGVMIAYEKGLVLRSERLGSRRRFHKIEAEADPAEIALLELLSLVR